MFDETAYKNIELPEEMLKLLKSAKSVFVPKTRQDLIDITLGNTTNDTFEVGYDVPGNGHVVEANVHRCKNGIAVNYLESYMRRRDPNAMVIADSAPTDKPKYEERFSKPYSQMKQEIFDWLTGQDLIVLFFYSGAASLNYGSVLIAPKNAAFFCIALADIQGFIDPHELDKTFSPTSVIYLAPTFRHTDCHGKQVVIHHRGEDLHEIFSLNLYPGPSAKKGVYSILLNRGEKEGWVTAHASTVRVTTPYDTDFVIMHEGASGGGKSEMLQYPQCEPNGSLLIGENILNQQRRYIPRFDGCSLRPISDDMALCCKHLQKKGGRLVIEDAEEGWFLRVNHIDDYGVEPYIEKLCTTPKEPLIFLNLYSVPRGTCLIWEHTEDEPGKPCPNPRVVVPRRNIPDILNKPVRVDVRSFGVRTPPCTKENPTYGIMGMLHILPPAIAWLWRLVAPRGYANPSITAEGGGMSSEGVGSYWPFATGRRVDQANLLLDQILDTPKTRYTLTANQHIGAWKVGFMSQWISREFLSRRGSMYFKESQITPARCPLLGYALNYLTIEGFVIDPEFLQVDKQPEIGPEAYDQGAKILTDFFKKELSLYLDQPDLDIRGRKIIEGCMEDKSLDYYWEMIGS